MALRKYHLLWASIGYLIYLGLIYFLDKGMNPIMVFLGLCICLFGTEVADFDQILGWMKHRDVITHSIFIPALLFGFFGYGYLDAKWVSLDYILVASPFFIGYGIHLWLDLFPTIDPERIAKKSGIWTAIKTLFKTLLQGLTSVELESHYCGTYLIHIHMGWIGFKTLSVHKTRWWLFFSGIVCFGMTGVLLVL